MVIIEMFLSNKIYYSYKQIYDEVVLVLWFGEFFVEFISKC
jgi:hypothetical protein